MIGKGIFHFMKTMYPPRGRELAYPEKVLLFDPVEPEFKGEEWRTSQTGPHFSCQSYNTCCTSPRKIYLEMVLMLEWLHQERDGSFQTENKVYQFWANANDDGCKINVGDLVYIPPPRDGPTLWKIGIPGRSTAEFFVPDPNPMYINRLYINHPADRFWQCGLWERYADL
ncbi:Rhamnogalacturonan endolyase [Forsythia ovata]|uniref:Rhamnogalacturonan endolyase n=1 Tax=Forsythia ovata TaxID=205694 RepID=A0ABD1UX72_9LAMI